MFCSKCGTENPGEAKFCAKCGAGLGTATPAGEEGKSAGESSTGMSANVAGLLCYVAGWITGIVFVVLEKKSAFVRFHAWQSIMTFGVLTVVQIILAMISGMAFATLAFGLWRFVNVLGVLVWVIVVGLWIALVVTAAMGKMWKVPLAGDWAEKQARK
jgi:uncharacterized membrane protein